MKASIQASIVLIRERLADLECARREYKAGLKYWNNNTVPHDPAERLANKKRLNNKLKANAIRRKQWQKTLADQKTMLLYINLREEKTV